MQFIPHTQEELKSIGIKDGEICTIQYLERDYFNADQRVELAKAKAVLGDDGFTFLVTDGMNIEKFIKNARVIK